jgi:hypothetical protein
VEAVVEGSVLRSGDRIRIIAQLIRAPADQHMWAKSYEADFRDTLTHASVGFPAGQGSRHRGFGVEPRPRPGKQRLAPDDSGFDTLGSLMNQIGLRPHAELGERAVVACQTFSAGCRLSQSHDDADA